MFKYTKIFPLTIALIGLISCANMNSSTNINLSTSEADKLSVNETNGDYYLQPGDELDVKFFYNPELNETVIIRLDKKISLQLIGELTAAGLTPSELNKVIIEKYTGLIQEPEIIVIVKGAEDERIYIGGEVMLPGSIPLISGKTTVLQAIFNAGGFKETSDPRSVIIIRRDAEGMPITNKVNLKQAISGIAPKNDIFLQPFDIVYVPKTFIAKANKSVEQYIKNMIPGTLNAGFSYFVGKTRTQNSTSTERGF